MFVADVMTGQTTDDDITIDGFKDKETMTELIVEKGYDNNELADHFCVTNGIISLWRNILDLQEIELHEWELEQLYWNDEKSFNDIAKMCHTGGQKLWQQAKDCDMLVRSSILGSHISRDGNNLDNTKTVVYDGKVYKADEYIYAGTLTELYHDKGLTQKEISDIFNVTNATIGNHMKENDIDTRDPVDVSNTKMVEERDPVEFEGSVYDPLDYREQEVLQELYHDKGLTQKEIASVFDVSCGIISSHMNKQGVEARDVGYNLRSKETVEANEDDADDDVVITRMKLLELHYEDTTIVEAAEQLGVTTRDVFDACEEHGVYL